VKRLYPYVKNLKKKADGRNWIILFLVLLTFFTGLRLLRLNADPSPDLSVSAALYTDEGFKAYSSMNVVRYGDWKWTPRDNYGGWYEGSPVPTQLYIAWFKLFGIGFASLRAMNVLFGMLTMAALFFIVRRYYDNLTAFVSMTLFGTSNFLIGYNRMGFFENLQVFFALIVFYCFCELFSRRGKVKKALSGRKVNLSREFHIMVAAAAVGTIATAAALMTKQSVSIVFFALIPFFTHYFFYRHSRLNPHLIHKFYATIIVFVLGYMVVAHFGWFEMSFRHILDKKFFNVSLNYLFPIKAGSGSHLAVGGSESFDPVYMSFVKSLYLEFVYLQPIVFFCGLFFAFYTYYRFLYRQKLHVMDAAFATWFLFGFLFLAIMKYHPSRYYMLIVIPMIVLAARFIVSYRPGLKDRLPLGRWTLKRLAMLVFWFYFIYYTGLSLVLSVIPFSVRKKVYDYAYSNIMHNNPSAFIPLLIGVAVYLVLVFVIVIPLIPVIQKQLLNKRFYAGVFAFILIFDAFLYLKWVTTSDTKLYDYSVRVGKELPAKAVIAGCWSADFAIEGGQRALVLQEAMGYNKDTLDSILRNEPIRVKSLDVKGVKQREYVKDLPLYLSVGMNMPADIKIKKAYSQYIIPSRLVMKDSLGLYDVEVYRLSGPDRMKK
jgi:4-amino-4-deoxy-L-arabinose transferase-like glycosyltransferase